MNWILTAIFLLFASPALAYGPITCPAAQPNDIVLILAGQSNNGAYGDVGYQPPATNGDVQIWWGTGTCYPLNDGLAGFPSPWMPLSGGSIWTRFSQLLRDQSPSWTGRLVIVDIAQNGSPITSWAQTGPFYSRIQTAVNLLTAGGWTSRAMLFMGGESDALSGATYSDVSAAIFSMTAGVRTAGNTFPIFMGITTTCRAIPNPAKPNGIDGAGVDFENLATPASRDYHVSSLRMYQQSEVHRALMASANQAASVFLGPNTDMISATNRWDMCHMNSYAQWLSAQMWLDYLRRAELVP